MNVFGTIWLTFALVVAAPAAQEWRAAAIDSFDLAWKTVGDALAGQPTGDLDWEQVRGDLRPRVVEAASAAEAREVLREMLRRLGRSHFALFSTASGEERSAGPTRAPIDPRIVPEGAVVSTSDVTLGNLPSLAVRVEAIERRTPQARRVGVIAFNLWMPAIDRPFADAIDRFRSADGLVIDLRGNAGGLADMMRGIAGHVLDSPELLGRMHMGQAELEFRANPRRATDDGRRVSPFAGPVAILVDELTASTSECFAGGLQSLGRARVFGVRTSGQALPASTKRLPSGDVLMYAIGDFVTSTGQRLEGRGVVPDEEVPAGSSSLEAALNWIDRH